MARPAMLITGGSRGIGAATAERAARSGFDVLITYVSAEDAARDVVGRCTASGVDAVAVQADASVETEVVASFEACVGRFGRLDAVINNAGILHPAMRLDEMGVERWREVVAVNVIGAFIVAREAVRRMSTRHGGRGGAIVNVSSAAAYLGSPNEFIDYAATKGALDTMTIGLAREVAAEGVRVNAVRPGLIETDIHASSGIPDRIARLAPNVPMQRGGTADEVAAAIVWLAGDDASYVTGSFIDCTGGR